MQLISVFENLTGSKIKDCFDHDGLLYFVVQEGQIGLALGRKGSNIRRLERVFNRKIKIVEFNPDINRFINNIIFPLKTEEQSIEDGVITLKTGDLKTRGLLIGRGGQNLRRYENLAKRYFQLKEIKVA